MSTEETVFLLRNDVPGGPLAPDPRNAQMYSPEHVQELFEKAEISDSHSPVRIVEVFFGRKVAEVCANMLKKPTSVVRWLELERCTFGCGCAEIVLNALEQSPIRVFHLTLVDLSHLHCQLINKWLMNCSPLFLRLTVERAPVGSIMSLFKGCKNQPLLEGLELNGFNITETKDLEVLCDLVSNRNSHIMKLNLEGTKISQSSLLLEAINLSSSLDSLNLVGVLTSVDELRELEQNLEDHQSLEHLELGDLSEDMTEELMQTLSSLQIHSLKLMRCSGLGEMEEAFLEVISKNRFLHQLVCDEAQIMSKARLLVRSNRILVNFPQPIRNLQDHLRKDTASVCSYSRLSIIGGKGSGKTSVMQRLFYPPINEKDKLQVFKRPFLHRCFDANYGTTIVADAGCQGITNELLVGYSTEKCIRPKTVEPLPTITDLEVAKQLASIGLGTEEETSKVRQNLNWARFKINCWDMGGLSQCSASQKLFYVNSSLVLVVFRCNDILNDCSATVSSVVGWVQDVEAVASDCRFILVATHIDKLVEPNSFPEEFDKSMLLAMKSTEVLFIPNQTKSAFYINCSETTSYDRKDDLMELSETVKLICTGPRRKTENPPRIQAQDFTVRWAALIHQMSMVGKVFATYDQVKEAATKYSVTDYTAMLKLFETNGTILWLNQSEGTNDVDNSLIVVDPTEFHRIIGQTLCNCDSSGFLSEERLKAQFEEASPESVQFYNHFILALESNLVVSKSFSDKRFVCGELETREKPEYIHSVFKNRLFVTSDKHSLTKVLQELLCILISKPGSETYGNTVEVSGSWASFPFLDKEAGFFVELDKDLIQIFLLSDKLEDLPKLVEHVEETVKLLCARSKRSLEIELPYLVGQKEGRVPLKKVRAAHNQLYVYDGEEEVETSSFLRYLSVENRV